jgi:glycosyltransferase involved in cell wall biosynthesis
VLYSVLGPAAKADVPVVATAHDYGQVCATKTMRYLGDQPCDGPGLAKCVHCAWAHYGPKGVPLAAVLHQIGSRRNRSVARWMAISTAVAETGSAPRLRDRSPITVLPTFFDDALRELATAQQVRNRPAAVPASGPYLFYAGALGAHKGVDVLLDAHARLAAGPGGAAPLVLAGLPQPGFALGERDGVTVVRRMPHDDVLAAFRHASVGVVPSVWAEPLGRVAVECLAAGTPCVVSATGGLVDVVEDEVQGLHVPPGDAAALAAALRRLLDDAELRARLGAAGPAKAAEFTLSTVLPKLCSLYLQVLYDRGQPWPGPVPASE